MIIQYVSGPCGSGKSRQFAKRAIAQANEGKATMIVCQTTLLLDQYSEMIGTEATTFCIHQKNTKGVLSAVYNSLTGFIETSGIMLITFATFQQLSIGRIAGDFDVIFDEIPSIIDPITLNIAESHSFLTDHIERRPEDGLHSVLSARNPQALTQIFENRKNDNVYAAFRNISEKILSKHWSVYVITAQYYKLVSKVKNDRPEQIDFFPILKTSIFKGFRSVIIGSANFEDSLLYALLNNDVDIKLTPHMALTNSLRYMRHTNGKLIDIYYAYNAFWSKNFIRNTDALTKCVGLFESILSSKPYVWSANNDQKDNLFAAGASHRLPASPHGLNSFQNYHNVATVGAFNLKPSTISFFNVKYRLSGESICNAINNEMNYQIACRISIRAIDDMSPKIICVPDHGLAVWLQSKFPESRVHYLEGDAEGDLKSKPKPSKPKAQRKPNRIAKKESVDRKNERKRARVEELQLRFEQARKRSSEEEGLVRISSPPPSGADLQNSGNTNDLIDIGADVTRFYGSVWKSKYDTRPLINLSCDDFDEICVLFKTFHKETYESKDKNFLISPSLFWAQDSTLSRRTKDDVLYCGMLWLDNDGGGITEKDFAYIFNDINFIIYDTYSSTKACRRYRICIPLERPVTPHEYQLLISEIFDRLSYNGWDFKPSGDKRLHGFDKMGSLTTSLLYLPCQASDPRSSRLKAYKTDRKILDPNVWLDDLLNPPVEPTITTSPPLVPMSDNFLPGAFTQAQTSPSIKTDGISDTRRAMEIWNRQRSKPGCGHKAFWTLALHLAKSGVSENDLEHILWQESLKARSTKERQQEISGILIQLRKRGDIGSTPIPHSHSHPA